MEKTELSIVRSAFARGYNLGKLVPDERDSFQGLQAQFEAKALDKTSKNQQKFKALHLGFETALKDRGLLREKPKKLESLKKLIDNIVPDVWEDKWIKKGKGKDNEMEIDF